MKEDRLLRRLREGRQEALEAVIDRYAGYVYVIISNIVCPPLPPEDAEELCSECFLRLWEHREQAEAGKLKAYLAAIARNLARDRLRRARLELPLEEDALELPCEGPEAALLRRELQTAVRDCILSLPPPDGEILQRYYYLYQRTGEIAGALGLPLSTVTTKLARGRARLRKQLEERGYSHENAHI